MCQFCLHTKMLPASSSFRKGRCMFQHIRTIYPGSTQRRPVSKAPLSTGTVVDLYPSKEYCMEVDDFKVSSLA